MARASARASQGKCKHRKGDGICQTADGRWITVVEGPRKPDGRRDQRRKRFDTEREARAWKHEQETAKRHGGLPLAGKLTVQDFAQEWLTAIVPARGVKDRTILDYQDYLDRYLLPAIGGLNLADVTPLHLDRLYRGLLTEGKVTPAKSHRGGPKKPRPLAGRTVRHLHTIVRDMFETARKKRLLATNPAVDAEVPSVPGATKARFKVWAPDECKRFLARADLDPYQALWHLLLATGMRLGEARGLTWPDVDIKNRAIHVASTLSLDLKREDKRTRPKTDSGDRTIPIPADLVVILKEHRRTSLEARLQRQASPAVDYVFCAEPGRPLDEGNIRHRFQRLVRDSGVTSIRIHDCRHTFASLALASGVPVTEVSAILGHANAGITMALYAHFIPGNQHRPTEAVAAAIYGTKTHA
jgi:integrase